MEDVIKRYKIVKTKVGVIEERLRGMKTMIAELPSELVAKSPKELEEICKEKLSCLEESIAQATELLEEVEKLRLEHE